MEHVLTLFEATAARFPEKTAVACKDKKYSFDELKNRASCLAAEILKCKAMKNQPVAVVVSRDADAMVYFLAVLYSGNYYVPIDPEMPAPKRQMILDDCQPQVILCGSEQEGLLAELTFSGCRINPAEVDYETGLPQLQVDFQEDDPIYMVYTSGSTGKPKGVLKSHRAVCSFIKAFAAEFELTDREVIGNQTPFFFDASAKDIYLMLYTGATLEIIPSELFMYPPKLLMYLNERKVTYICWVPTALAMVSQLQAYRQVKPEYLKKVLFVGEVFPIKQLRRWIEALPELTYVNLYGSTELSGIGCFYRVDTSSQPESMPMGKPLSNCRVFLYDEKENQVLTEPEKTGEVCIISDALALEYYHDPEKTASVFVRAAEEAGQLRITSDGNLRVLKTGDLAHYNEDGDLVFSTRKDFQIKLFGRRIELGEIETAADKVEEIQRCACIFDSEKQKIRMYCELIPGCDWTGRQVREELKNRLSDYMVPTTVKIMEKLPLNANGKIDRTALKAL